MRYILESQAYPRLCGNATQSVQHQSQVGTPSQFALRVVRGTAIVIASVFLCGCNSESTESVKPPSSQAANASSPAPTEVGDKVAMFALGRAISLGSDGHTKDEFLAFNWYLRAAEAGLPEAMAEVARRYQIGLGVREDIETSMRWAEKGAELGDPKAIVLSGSRDPVNLFVGFEELLDADAKEEKLIQHSKTKVARLTQAADTGNLDAKLQLGRLLRTGVLYQIKGKHKNALVLDVERAQKALVEAADAGSATAALDVARWYQLGGDGVKADPIAAAKYWSQIEAISTPEGQYSIGHELRPPEKRYYQVQIWRDRKLTYEQCGRQAREWLDKAARGGHAQAALELGKMLYQFGYEDLPASFENFFFFF